MSSQEALDRARGIILTMKLGGISYAEAKEKAQPYLDICNARIKEIAKKYKKPAYEIKFTKLAR